MDDARTSNVCHRHNFPCREFSDIVPDTITIFKHNLKKKDRNLITFNTVPLRSHWKLQNYSVFSDSISRATIIACTSEENIDVSTGKDDILIVCQQTAAAPTPTSLFDPSVKITTWSLYWLFTMHSPIFNCIYIFDVWPYENSLSKRIIFGSCYIIIIKKKSRRCKAGREWYTPFSVRRPRPHNTNL